MKKTLAIIGASFALAIGGMGLSATPFTPAVESAQAVTYSNCFTAMNGERWCYQSNCNWWEYTFNGCRDGWVKSNTWYALKSPAPQVVLTSI